MTSDSPEAAAAADSRHPWEAGQSSRRVHTNQVMLDLRQQVRRQEGIIRSLVSEKDGLTRELDSRLFLVEAQLRREQKHIETVLNEKEQTIQFQELQIHSLKQLLARVSQTSRSQHRASRRLLSKRYSVALDEYMRDHCVVSRALPVMVRGEGERAASRSRARSLPELRFREDATAAVGGCCPRQSPPCAAGGAPEEAGGAPFGREDLHCEECYRILSREVMEEVTGRRWTSDCDSEHSDSLDSGISSPSIQSRIAHDYFDPHLYRDNEKRVDGSGRFACAAGPADEAPEPRREPAERDGQKPRRSSSIGNFIHRTFSSSSPEKTKENPESRRHSASFSGAEAKSLETPPRKSTFISSANRTFGTNHRSVTKPRDVKFRKLFKFRRRAEPELTTSEDYMTV